LPAGFDDHQAGTTSPFRPGHALEPPLPP